MIKTVTKTIRPLEDRTPIGIEFSRPGDCLKLLIVRERRHLLLRAIDAGTELLWRVWRIGEKRDEWEWVD